MADQERPQYYANLTLDDLLRRPMYSMLPALIREREEQLQRWRKARDRMVEDGHRSPA